MACKCVERLCFAGEQETDVIISRDIQNVLEIKLELSILSSGQCAIDVDDEYVCSVLNAGSESKRVKKEAMRMTRIMSYDNPEEDPSENAR